MDRLRRCALQAIALAPVVGPLAAFAQAPARPTPKLVAIPLGPSTAPDPIGPTRKSWAELFAKHGLVDGQGIEIGIYRAKTWRQEDLAPLARRVVDSRPDVIVTPHAEMLPHLSVLTRDDPIVTMVMEPLLAEHTASLNRPGANVTGMAPSDAADFARQQMQLVKEVRPGARSLAYPVERIDDGPAADWMRRAKRKYQPMAIDHARSFGMEITWIEVERETIATTIIGGLQRAPVDVLAMSCYMGPRPGPEFWESLAKMGVAVVTDCRNGVRDGALLGSWDVLNIPDTLARVAARILRGEKPAEIPLERARDRSVAVNLRTARSLGLTVPPSVLLRATDVFE